MLNTHFIFVQHIQSLDVGVISWSLFLSIVNLYFYKSLTCIFNQIHANQFKYECVKNV